jgi:putative hemolysin
MNFTALIWFMFVLCLGASFLLSGMEAGVFALNRLRVRRLARAGQRPAQLLNGFLEKPERFLWTILVGNTLANFLIFGWLLAELHEWFLGQRLLIAGLFIAAVFIFYAFLDLLPKMLFRAHPNSLCLSSARIFRVINFVLQPLVLMVEDISKGLLRLTGGRVFTVRLFGNREELRAVMQESGRTLTDDERAMVNRILDLQNFTVGQIAKPFAEISTVESTTPLRDALAIARTARKISGVCRSGKRATENGGSPGSWICNRCSTAKNSIRIIPSPRT